MNKKFSRSRKRPLGNLTWRAPWKQQLYWASQYINVMLDKWYVNVLYFVFRAAKLDSNFEIPSDGESASSDSDSDESSGEPWCDRSSLPIHEQSTYLVYEFCLHELCKYRIKCGNQILSNVAEEFGYTGSQLTYRFTCANGMLIFS